MRHLYMRTIRLQAIGLVLVLMLLAACGANTPGTTTGGGTSAGTTTPPPAQHCGVVHAQRLQIVPADQNLATAVENCFWQAYQQCHPATMTYSLGNLDTVMLHTFSLKSQSGQCVITDAVQRSVLPRPPQAAGSYICGSLTRQSDGLRFTACGSEGNVLVPSVGTV